MSTTAAPPEAADMVPIEHESAERVVRTMVFGLPPAALALGGWLAWGGALHWQDLAVLAVTYTLTGLGIRSAITVCSRTAASRHRALCESRWPFWARWRSRGP
jgi:hypothetical protein